MIKLLVKRSYQFTIDIRFIELHEVIDKVSTLWACAAVSDYGFGVWPCNDGKRRLDAVPYGFLIYVQLGH